MNPNENKEPREIEAINDRICRFAAILMGLGAILGCYAYAKVDAPVPRLLLFIAAGFLLILGGFILLVVAVGSKQEKKPHTNFFLYDRRTKSNIEPKDLTVDEIRERVCRYMTSYMHRGKLYIGELFDEPTIPDQFKTLFCYELLCQIAEDGEDKAEIFLSYGYECSEIFGGYLSSCEDYELARQIKGYVLDFPTHKEILSEFTSLLVSEKEHLESTMLRYTLENLHKF